MIATIHFDVDEIMLKESIEIHDINKTYYSFQSFLVNIFQFQIIQQNFIKILINYQ
jgi:hypothetical protein